MTSSLPSSPSLVQLRKQAKELLKAYRAADASCLRVLQHLPALQKATSAPAPGVDLSLADVQFALARDYGFANWAALKAKLSPQPGIEDINDHREPFFESMVPHGAHLQTRGLLRWLQPIPRFPLKVRQVDASGKTIKQVTGPRGLIHGLAYTMRMLGHDVPLHLVMAASGEAFRFTFSDTWHYDAKAMSPIDAAACACRSLGFDYTLQAGQTWQEAWQAVEIAIEHGRPALVGTDPLHWRLVVGLDRATGEYLYIGGDPWSGEWQAVEVKPGEPIPTSLPIEQCRHCPRPQQDWYARYLGPQQMIKNPVLVLGERQRPTDPDMLRAVLRTAVDLHAAATTQRISDGVRAEASAAGCRAAGSLSPGRYITGVEGLRRWADAIEAMAEPSHDPKYIHAHDIDLGEQLMFLAEGVRFLGWAAERLPAEAKPHLAAAGDLLAKAEQRSTWRGARQCLVNFGCDCKTPEEVLVSQARPSLVTIYPKELESLLVSMGLSVGKCWLGLSVLPDWEHFEAARKEAVENIRCIADLREQACGHLAQAAANI